MEKTIRVMLIVTGVSSPQIFGSKNSAKDRAKKNIEKEFGIEFLD